MFGAVESALALSETFSREILARRNPDLNRIACAKGCAWCCHYQVGVTAPQALHIASKVAAGAASLPVDAIKKRLKILDARTRGLDASERFKARLGCAFLDQGACRLCGSGRVQALFGCAFHDQGACTCEPFRPFGGRGANSVNADLCRAIVEGTADAKSRQENWLHKVPYEAQRDVQDGFHMGALQNGLHDDRLELTAAV